MMFKDYKEALKRYVGDRSFVVFKNKYSDEYYTANTVEHLIGAFLDQFELYRRGFVESLINDGGFGVEETTKLCKKALEGDEEAIVNYFFLFRDSEYEGFSFDTLTDAHHLAKK